MLDLCTGNLHVVAKSSEFNHTFLCLYKSMAWSPIRSSIVQKLFGYRNTVNPCLSSCKVSGGDSPARFSIVRQC